MKKLARSKDYAEAQALYNHCLAPCTELVIKNAARELELFSDSLDLGQNFSAFLGAYPKGF